MKTSTRTAKGEVGFVVSSVTVDGVSTPMGIDDVAPDLAWVLSATDDSRAERQSAYRIRVSKARWAAEHHVADVWDSGRVESSTSTGVPYAGPELAGSTAYYWTVEVWDAAGQFSAVSAVASWETGILGSAGWHGARWIGGAADTPTSYGGRGYRVGAKSSAAQPIDLDRAAVDLRGVFTIAPHVRRARAYISGLGYYELVIDGQRVGDRVLDPGVTAYDRRVLYSTYDVTEFLGTPGEHAAGISLGHGFYGLDPRDTAYYWADAPWLGAPRACLLLLVDYADGGQQSFVTDGTWRTHSSATTQNSIYLGETFDARLVQPGWSTAGFDAAHWRAATVLEAPTANVRSQTMDPIRVVRSIEAISITEPRPGTFVAAFPTMTAGWITLAVEGPRGTEVTLAYGETLLTDGTVDNAGDPGMTTAPVQVDRYILSGDGRETWQPRFSYKGFQFVQIDGYPGVPTVQDLIAQVVHTDAATTGSFESTDATLNAIHELARRTIENNLHSVLTDSPMFEKRAWLGDVNVLLATTMNNFSLRNFYRSWLATLRLQQGDDGSGVEISPGPEVAAYADPLWSGALVDIPRSLYRYYGDVRSLNDSYDGLRRFLDHLVSEADELIQAGFYGDWSAPIESGTFPWAPEGPRLAATAYFYAYARGIAEISRILGRRDDEQEVRQLAGRIRRAFIAEFFDPDAGIYRTPGEPGYRQTSNALALALGLVPAGDEARVAAALAADVERRGFHLDTGHAGTKELLPVLTRYGYVDTAFRVATQTTYPSWGYWLAQGATSMWESWHDATRSRDHPFLGTVDDWFFQDLAGIRPRGAGFERLAIVPHFPHGLDGAAATMTTVRGVVASRWRRSGDALTVEVTIPVTSSAVVVLPSARDWEATRESGGDRGIPFAALGNTLGMTLYRIGSGTHTFRSLQPGRPVR